MKEEIKKLKKKLSEQSAESSGAAWQRYKTVQEMQKAGKPTNVMEAIYFSLLHLRNTVAQDLDKQYKLAQSINDSAPTLLKNELMMQDQYELWKRHGELEAEAEKKAEDGKKAD